MGSLFLTSDTISMVQQTGLETAVFGDTILVTFTRPEIRNPLSMSVINELISIVDGLSSTPSFAKLIFTGTDNVFASGADLREIAELTNTSATAFAKRGQHLMNAVSGLDIMTVAAINGYCFGGALDLTLACDRRVASPAAEFAHPGAGLGIITGWGGTQRLPRLVGTGNAMEMFMTASPIAAHDALRVGLIDAISDEPLKAALEIT